MPRTLTGLREVYAKVRRRSRACSPRLPAVQEGWQGELEITVDYTSLIDDLFNPGRPQHSIHPYRLQPMEVDVDVADWPTKQEAALQLDISGRSIDRLLRQGRLKKGIRRGSGVPVVVIDPETIAECQRSAAEKSDPGASVVLARIMQPAALPMLSPSAQVPALVRSGAASGLEAAFLAFLQSKIPASQIPVERRIFLTLAESAEYSGLPVAFLRRLIASGKLKALKTGAGWRVSRVELEESSGTLTQTPEELEEQQLRDLEVNRRRRQGTALPPIE